ncbi:hypothetical protein [Collimonas pratensis]|uniref:hypothetical protein n=1 Tax=Collimonas pratensis TaxID=279113 RepID=UPI0007808333|nr:hypothetical protein [Collimonas pratensis]
MKPTEAAKALLLRLELPPGAATILPWKNGDTIVMHVLIDSSFIRSVKVPNSFEGYEVMVKARSPGVAYAIH